METNKVALVTGASRGIGRQVSLDLSSKGFELIVNYNKNKDLADELVSIIVAGGGKALAVQGDVGNPDDVRQMKSMILNHYQHLDVLVNNAGIIIRPAEWNKISDDDIMSTIKINLLGPMYMIREFSSLIEKSMNGNIINITTTYSYNGAAPVLAYTSAKAGINSLTKALAKELSEKNIRVNAIAPGNFDTDMTNSGGQGLVDWAISTTPLKRLGKPYEISECVEFLINSKFITGHIINIDGGQILTI